MPSPQSLAVALVIQAQSGLTVMARVIGQLGTPVNQAAITSIAWTLTNLQTGVPASGTFVVATTVFNSLVQNDPRWRVDSPANPNQNSGLSGYNFLGIIAATSFPLSAPSPVPAGYPTPPPPQYQLDVAFTPVSGQPFRLPPVRVTVGPTYG